MVIRRDTTKFSAEEIAEVESPELSDEELALLRPALEALSPKLFAALTATKPRLAAASHESAKKRA